jgi:RNA polymerase sigma factor (sigma-70 family)
VTAAKRLTPDEAVVQFTPFVMKMAKKYSHSGEVEFEDLVQEGLLAVALAAKDWQKSGGANMLTWIHAPVWRAMSRRVWLARRKGFKSPPKAEGTRRTPARVQMASMDAPIAIAADSTDLPTLHDVIGTFTEPPDYFALKRLPAALAKLNTKERRVIRLRFREGLRLREIGKILNLSRERVRQIEASALAQLRVFMHSVGKELTS